MKKNNNKRIQKRRKKRKDKRRKKTKVKKDYSITKMIYFKS